MSKYGSTPERIGYMNMHLPELMHYLYLPIMMPMSGTIRLPHNLECCEPMVETALSQLPREYAYCYISAVRGIASPGNALNRPGWHCDGFGTDDANVIWWKGPGTRFAVQPFVDISEDCHSSIDQFEDQVRPENIFSYEDGGIYMLDPYCVHSTPEVSRVCERQFVKLSFSDDRYDLEGNSHNYLFNYAWDMKQRSPSRNITSAAHPIPTPA